MIPSIYFVFLKMSFFTFQELFIDIKNIKLSVTSRQSSSGWRWNDDMAVTRGSPGGQLVPGAALNARQPS